MASKFIKLISNSGTISENVVAIISYLAILAIFPLDVISGSEVVLQLFYFIPLILIALHVERKDLLIGAVVLSVVIQIITLLTYDISAQSRIIEILMIFFTNVLVAFVSRYARMIIIERMHVRN